MLTTIVNLLTKYGVLFRDGLAITLTLSLRTIAAGALLGVAVCMMRMSRFAPLRALCAAYIEVIRGLPLLLQLYMFVFLLPRVLPVKLSDTQAVGLSLILYSAAYISELIRAGIQAVDFGQTEAARSLGLSAAQAMRKVVLPQAVANILPAMISEFTVIIKNTSLASVFFAGELMTVQKNITGSLYLAMEPMLIVGVLYLIMNFTLSRLVLFYERRVRAA